MRWPVRGKSGMMGQGANRAPWAGQGLRLGARSLWMVLVAVALIVLAACGRDRAPAQEATLEPTVAVATATPVPTPTPTPIPAIPPQPPISLAAGRIPAYGYEIVATLPHDAGAYTQGLQYVDGLFYESTGRNGMSSLRRVEPETGRVQQRHDLAAELFGEGLAVVGERIYQLTWQSNVAFVYDKGTFAEIERFSYPGEGWGLTWDGSRLLMSDGSDAVVARDPRDFSETGRIQVTYQGQPLLRLNELEYINGEIWANVYQSDWVVRIDPVTGAVTSVVDLAGLLANVEVTGPVDVLNGIAWDEAGQRLFVTGKWWPAVFQIRLKQIGWMQ